MRRNHTVAEFSHNVSLLNERENLILRRTASHLDIQKRYCARTHENEILKVKQRAERLNMSVRDYHERQPKYAFEALQRRYEEGQKRKKPVRRTPSWMTQKASDQQSLDRRHSVGGDLKLVHFKVDVDEEEEEEEEDEEESSPSPKVPPPSPIVPPPSPTVTTLSGDTSSGEDRIFFPRPPPSAPSRTRSADAIRRSSIAGYPISGIIKGTGGSYVARRNSIASKPEKVPAQSTPSRHGSVDIFNDASEGVTFDEIQSPYKLFRGIGKRSQSVVDIRNETRPGFRRRRFLVVPKYNLSDHSNLSSSMLSRPQTAPNKLGH